jgi:hypothetical protein
VCSIKYTGLFIGIYDINNKLFDLTMLINRPELSGNEETQEHGDWTYVMWSADKQWLDGLFIHQTSDVKLYLITGLCLAVFQQFKTILCTRFINMLITNDLGLICLSIL